MPEFAVLKGMNPLVKRVRFSIHAGAGPGLLPWGTISATEPFSTLGPSGASEYGSNLLRGDGGHLPSGGGLLVTAHQYLLESLVHQLVAQSSRKPVIGLIACAPDASARS